VGGIVKQKSKANISEMLQQLFKGQMPCLSPNVEVMNSTIWNKERELSATETA